MTDSVSRCCGSCKWLTGGVEAHHVKRDLTIKDRYRFTVFECTVPFIMPDVPECIRVTSNSRQMMAPYYGLNCKFWKRREA